MTKSPLQGCCEGFRFSVDGDLQKIGIQGCNWTGFIIAEKFLLIHDRADPLTRHYWHKTSVSSPDTVVSVPTPDAEHVSSSITQKYSAPGFSSSSSGFQIPWQTTIYCPNTFHPYVGSDAFPSLCTHHKTLQYIKSRHRSQGVIFRYRDQCVVQIQSYNSKSLTHHLASKSNPRWSHNINDLFSHTIRIRNSQKSSLELRNMAQVLDMKGLFSEYEDAIILLFSESLSKLQITFYQRFP